MNLPRAKPRNWRRPLSPAHLLQTGELAQHFPHFQALIARDAFERDGRFFSACWPAQRR